jgi:sulfide:quinone oxidoreductase
MDIKEIDQRYRVSDQLHEADLDTLAAQGVKLLVNFRPDGEGGATQPSNATLASKAAALGMAYAHIPVVPNQVKPEHGLQLKSLLDAHPGPVLGFCRTGNRANQVYQLAQQGQPPSATNTKPACCSQQPEQEGLLNKVKNWFN